MRQRILWPWVAGFALTVAGAAMNCGGDDTTTTTGPTGTAGSSTGRGGSGGSSTTTAGGKGGSGGSGGTAGSAGSGGSGGLGGSGGSAGAAGSGGQRDAGDAGPDTSTDAPRPDAPSDAPASDASSDALDAAAERTFERPDGSVSFAEVTDIFSRRCSGCHRPRETGQQLLDLVTPDGLHMRLTSPLPDSQEGKCGFPDAGTGDAGDGGDGAAPPNRQAIVPGDTGASLLFLKITGNQPAGCGLRMPRVTQFGEDGAPAGSVGCDTADGGATSNCLSQRDLDTIRDWITQGAPP